MKPKNLKLALKRIQESLAEANTDTTATIEGKSIILTLSTGRNFKLAECEVRHQLNEARYELSK